MTAATGAGTGAGAMPAPLMLSDQAGFVPSSLPGLRKAAILIVTLGEELAKNLLRGLSVADVQKVTDEIMHLGDVSAEQCTQILTEFYGLLETQQYMGKGGSDYALRLLTQAFGPERAEQMLAQVKDMQQRSQGDLKILQKMDPQQLSKFLANEHPQTVALGAGASGCAHAAARC